MLFTPKKLFQDARKMSVPHGAAGLAPIASWGKGWTRALSMVLSLLGTTVQATPIVAPIGLAPGSSYQLIFVTRDTHNGLSADQSVYNSFVSEQAALNVDLPSTTWHSITTAFGGTSYSENAPWLNLPVYNTQGELVSTAAGLYAISGSPALNAAIGYDQFGAALNTPVFTGGYGEYGLGYQDGVARGRSDLTTRKWFVGCTGAGCSSLAYPSEALSFYALSEAIVPGGVVPEPTTLVLFGLGLLGLGFNTRRRLN